MKFRIYNTGDLNLPYSLEVCEGGLWLRVGDYANALVAEMMAMKYKEKKEGPKLVKEFHL